MPGNLLPSTSEARTLTGAVIQNVTPATARSTGKSWTVDTTSTPTLIMTLEIYALNAHTVIATPTATFAVTPFV